MHEVSIAQSIISIIKDLVPTPDAKVTKVSIVVGELSSIETDALQFSFDIVKSKTVLSEALLHIDKVTGRGQCVDCETIFDMHNYATACPQCSSYFIKVLQGKEMKVLSFDVE